MSAPPTSWRITIAINAMNGNSIYDFYVDDERIWIANYPIGITVRNNNMPVMNGSNILLATSNRSSTIR